MRRLIIDMWYALHTVFFFFLKDSETKTSNYREKPRYIASPRKKKLTRMEKDGERERKQKKKEFFFFFLSMPRKTQIVPQLSQTRKRGGVFVLTLSK